MKAAKRTASESEVRSPGSPSDSPPVCASSCASFLASSMEAGDAALERRKVVGVGFDSESNILEMLSLRRRLGGGAAELPHSEVSPSSQPFGRALGAMVNGATLGAIVKEGRRLLTVRCPALPSLLTLFWLSVRTIIAEALRLFTTSG